MSEYIGKLEDYNDLEASIIRSTKINKVLKAIKKLPTIPKDEEFNFTKRSDDLLAAWNVVLAANPEEAQPVNGVNKDSEPKAPESAVEQKDDAGAEKAVEPTATNPEATVEPTAGEKVAEGETTISSAVETTV